jgi:holo-[acyl-carrier protein] synthase
MIFGIGTDLVAVARIASSLARFGEPFARRLLGDDEFTRFADAPHPARFLAKRFAAKEAFAKAAGTGLRVPVTLQNIAIVHDAIGKPAFCLAPALADWLAKQGVRASHLSLSDEDDYACAFVVLER